MQEPLHLDLGHQAGQSSPRPLLGQAAHAHHQPHPQQLHLPAQGRVTDPKELLSLLGRQLGGGEVAPAGSQEEQRTQVVDEAVTEEDLGLSTEVPEKAPEPGTTHLGLRALQSQHWSLGVLLGRGLHRPPNAQPVPDYTHFPKGHLWGRRDTPGLQTGDLTPGL